MTDSPDNSYVSKLQPSIEVMLANYGDTWEREEEEEEEEEEAERRL